MIRRTHLVRVAVLTAVLFPSLTRASAPAGAEQTRFSRDTVVAELQRQAAARRINLGAVSAFAGKALSEISIEGPSVGADGSVGGTMSLGNAQAPVYLQYMPEADKRIGNWALAVRVPFNKLSDLVPSNPITDQFDVASPVLVFSRNDAEVRKADLSDAGKAFWDKTYGNTDYTVRIKKGVNILTAATLKAGSAADRSLRRIGFASGQLQIEGVVLRDFNVAELREAKANGKLAAALRAGTSIRATLPDFKLGKLPRGFATGNAYIEVSGKPSLALGFELDVPNEGGAPRKFTAELSLEREQGGASVNITARADGRWDNAFGLRGFALNSAVITLLIDTQQNIGFGLGADFEIGDRKIAVAGLAKFNMLTGVPTDVLVKGSINELGLRDLARLADRIARTAGKSVKVELLPDIKLKNFAFSFAPRGGNTALGIESGMSMSGTLSAMDSDLFTFDGSIDNTGETPVIKIIASARDIDVKGFRLTGASADILINALSSHFKVKGSCTVLAATRTLDVDLSKDRIHFRINDKLARIYETDFEFSSPAAANPFWTVRAMARQDLIRTLETDVANDIAAWRAKSNGDVDGASREVTAKQNELADLDRRIAAAKASARIAYDRFQGQVGDKIRAVNDAQRDADAKRREADNFDRLRAAAYQHRITHGNIITKRVPSTDETKYYTLHKAAIAEWGVKTAALQAAREILQRFLNTVSEPWLKNNLGVDAAPEVSRLVLERVGKDAAYKTAQGVLTAARAINDGVLRVSEYAARNAGKVFTVDQVDMAGAVGTSINDLGRARVQFRVAYTWLGKAHVWQFEGELGGLNLTNVGSLLKEAFKSNRTLGAEGRPTAPIVVPGAPAGGGTSVTPTPAPNPNPNPAPAAGGTLAAGAAVNVVFYNATAGQVKVYWAPGDGRELLYHTLDSKKSADQSTFVGHKWIARNAAGAEVKSFAADAPGTIMITPKLAPNTAAEVVFRNRTTRTIRVLWINFQNQEQFYFAVKPGQAQGIGSFVGHRWIVRYEDNGAAVRTLAVEAAGDIDVLP